MPAFPGMVRACARRACPLRATHDSSPVLLMSAPGRPSLVVHFPCSPRGERSAGRRGGVRDPRWMAGETTRWDALRRRPLPSFQKRGASRRSTAACLMMCGPRFRNVDQPRPSASSWQQVVLPASGAPPSPGELKCVAPDPRRRISRRRGFPPVIDPASSGLNLRPFPHRCSHLHGVP